MKKIMYTLALTSAMFLTACGGNDAPQPQQPAGNEQAQAPEHNHNHAHNDTDYNGIINVVTTFSILEDMVLQVGGELVNVYNIVPRGEEPEDHEVLPSNLMAVANSDVIFYNGMNLETAGYWFEDLLEATDRLNHHSVVRATQGIQSLFLQTEGLEDYEDPHAWLDLSLATVYVQNIADTLSNIAPQHADTFDANAEAFIAQLLTLHYQWIHAFDNIPDERRLLVTAEGAFRYFSLAYGLNVAYIWELNAEEEGTPEQMIRIIEIVNASDVPYLFTESSIEPYYIEQVSQETGVPIFGMLFTDSLDEEGEPAGTFYGMMRHNLETIYMALSL